MRKLYPLIIVLLFCIGSMNAGAQVLMATSAADLRLSVNADEAGEIILEGKTLSVTYEPGAIMKGELDLAALKTDNELLINLIDSLELTTVRFESRLPGSELLYGKAEKQTFSAEARVMAGNKESTTMFFYEANRKNTKGNSIYQISVRGIIDLQSDFDIQDEIGINKQIHFQFYQTIEINKY